MFSRDFGKKMPSHGQYLLKQRKAKVCRIEYHINPPTSAKEYAMPE